MHDQGDLTRRFDFLALYTVLYLGFIYLPVFVIPLFSFNDSLYVAFPLKGFTLQWYDNLINDSPGLFAALGNSIKVAGVVAVISTGFGLLAAKAVTRYRMPGKGVMVSFIMTPLVIPGIVIGIALLVLLNNAGVKLSLFSVGIGHMLVCVPFSMVVLISRLEGFDKGFEEAAQDLGERPWGVFWRVTFPLALPGIIASVLLTFTISFDEFILAFFLAGSDATLPVYIWSQLRFPNRLPSVLALGSLILLASFVIVVFAEWFRRRGGGTANSV
jgi:spermidine/putrescine transport system permease protein